MSYKNNTKSFYEDVFFTHSLYNKGYSLLIDGSILAYHPYLNPVNTITYIKTIPHQYKIVILFKKSKILFLLDIFCFTLVHLINDIKNIFVK